MHINIFGEGLMSWTKIINESNIYDFNNFNE